MTAVAGERERAGVLVGQLRAVLAAVDAGDLEAEAGEVVYLTGAVDALTVLVELADAGQLLARMAAQDAVRALAAE